jgi:hypothetical protein
MVCSSGSIGVQLFYLQLVVWHISFYQIPKISLMVFMSDMGKFMNDNIGDDSGRQFHEHGIQTKNIFTRTASPLPFCLSKTYGFRKKLHLAAVVFYNSGKVSLCFLSVKCIDMFLEVQSVLVRAVKKKNPVFKRERGSLFQTGVYLQRVCYPFVVE